MARASKVWKGLQVPDNWLSCECILYCLTSDSKSTVISGQMRKWSYWNISILLKSFSKLMKTLELRWRWIVILIMIFANFRIPNLQIFISWHWFLKMIFKWSQVSFSSFSSFLLFFFTISLLCSPLSPPACLEFCRQLSFETEKNMGKEITASWNQLWSSHHLKIQDEKCVQERGIWFCKISDSCF